MKPRVILVVAVTVALIGGGVYLARRMRQPSPEQFKEFAAKFAAEMDRQRKEEGKSLVVPGGKTGGSFTLISSDPAERTAMFESRDWTSDVASGASMSFKTAYTITFDWTGGKWVPVKAMKRAGAIQGFDPSVGTHNSSSRSGSGEEVAVSRFEAAAKSAQGTGN